MELEDIPGAIKLDTSSIRKAHEQLQEALTELLGPAAEQAARAIQDFPAAHKSAAAEKYEDEQLMHSLFGGPPRNRHERRKWAAMRRRGTR